ncbi:hypothetical protein pb186bvf_003009 [Paramecium bursaria]
MKILIIYYDDWGQIREITISISQKESIQHLRTLIEQHTDIPADCQNLYLGGQLIKDGYYLSDFRWEGKLLVKRSDDQFSQSFGSYLNATTSPINSLEYNNSFISNVFCSVEELRILEQLMASIRNDDLDQVRHIIQAGKDHQNLLNNVSLGWGPLHLATYHGFDKIFLLLLMEGSDVNLVSQDGWTCLMISIWQKKTTILTLIISQVGLDINKVTKLGSALHLAAKLDDIDSLKILLMHPNIQKEVLDQDQKRPNEVAATQVRNYYDKSFEIKQQEILKRSFLQSMSNIDASDLSRNSFLINRPNKPPILTGQVLKVNFFKLIEYPRFIIVDPDSGAMARFKSQADIPLNPNEIIPLEQINDIRIAKTEWFLKDNLNYIEIRYHSKHIYIALRFKQAARQWFESLKNAVGYVKYINQNINLCENEKKRERNLNKLMMERANEVIFIRDINYLDQDGHLKNQQIEKRRKYKQDLESVSEDDLVENDEDLDIAIKSTRSHVRTNLKFRDFEILTHIGCGAFGNVYKAKMKTNNKIFALKQQEKAEIISRNHLKYVQSELNIMKQLHNPFIINTYYSFQTPFYLYIATDYCPNGDLSKYMTRGVILDEFTAKFLIAQMVLAIEYLHSKQIIYRDLKPENIVIDEQGYIKLIDFGLSKVGLDDINYFAKSFCGSPAYLSPELIAGRGANKSTDIYSLGTMLYEMLTGYPPYFENNIKKLLHNIRYEKLHIPSKLSLDAQNLLMRLLEKEPEQRIGFKNINVLKKHIFFAELDWDKLQQKKYVPPKLQKRPDHDNKRGKQTKDIIRPLFDQDYEDNEVKEHYIDNWDYCV